MNEKDLKVLDGYDLGIIPEEHQFAHTLCFFLHDLILQTLREGEKADIFNIQISGEESVEAIKGKSGDELITWLEQNGHDGDVYILFYKQVFRAMLSDFCHFVFEALDCSKKGKLSVTYSLLRKPFKDHLIFFEWLLGDPGDFLVRFKGDDSTKLVTDKNPEKQKDIIAKAMEKLNPYWGTPEFLYELRYDKKSDIGFEGMLQHANHLVTIFKEYRTSPSNFNFIFSTGENMKDQWAFLYSFLPILMIHTYSVVEAIAKQFSIRKDEETDTTDFRVMTGFFLWMEEYWESEDALSAIKSAISAKGLGEIGCLVCESKPELTKTVAEQFFGQGTFKCSSCGTTVDFANRKLSVPANLKTARFHFDKVRKATIVILSARFNRKRE